MKVKELAEYCKSIEIDCYVCRYKEKCEKMTNILEEISPIGLIEFIENKDL